jgi:hypothetical protein
MVREIEKAKITAREIETEQKRKSFRSKTKYVSHHKLLPKFERRLHLSATTSTQE